MSLTSFATASELVARLRNREVGSRELVEHYLARIERWDPAVNAVVTVAADRARAEAAAADEAAARGEELGPLHGLPVTVKDSIETASLRTTCGSPDLADHVPARDATAVARLRAAGAVVLGKTNTPTWAADAQTTTRCSARRTTRGTGPGRRADRPAARPPRSRPGSPGWTSAATSAAPSACRPATAASTACARRTAWCRRAGTCRRRPAPAPTWTWRCWARWRAAPTTSPWRSTCSPDRTRRARWRGGSRCPRRAPAAWRGTASRRGSTTRPSRSTRRCSRCSPQRWTRCAATASRSTTTPGRSACASRRSCSSASPSRSWRPRLGQHEFEELTALAASGAGTPRARWARDVTAPARDWVVANERRQQLAAAWRRLFRDYDVLLCPVTPDDRDPARPHGGPGRPPHRRQRRAGAVLGSAPLGPGDLHVNLPVATVPVGLSAAGLPVGMQIVGPYLEDRTVIDVAARLASTIGGFRPPPGL